MTEFSRTTKAVDEIERLVQTVLDGGAQSDVQRLGELVGSTCPVVEKLGRKASEPDPAKRTYGPQMQQKVEALCARWEPIAGLARDVLGQRGAVVAAPAQEPTPSAPRASAFASLPNNTPPGGSGGVATPTARTAANGLLLPATDQYPARTAPPARALGGGGGPGPGSASAPSPAERRELALRAAEARQRPGGAAASGLTGSAASSSQPAMPMQPAAQMRTVGQMDELMHVAHCVFLGHGLTAAALEPAATGTAFRVRYAQKEAPSITAVYLPVQRHLVIYASVEGREGAELRTAVQLGMPAASVQAKVDYLLVYPLTHQQCLPALPAIPPEVLFSLLGSLALPALAALGVASRGLAVAIFEDEVLWWRVLLSLPASGPRDRAIELAKEAEQRGTPLPVGSCRAAVRQEVLRLRAEAEDMRRRRREAEDMERRMRRMGPRLGRGPQPFPGGPGGPGGLPVIGGPNDLFPGGVFPGGGGPFGGGGGPRRPFGGGGGGFGGGIF